jgi:TolB-like protein/Tfp pilus assembly protein PilF
VTTQVSHYRLLERIGRGAMGEVWLAEDTQLPRKVAVKLLAHHLAHEPDAIARLLREAQAAASVDHPAIVTVYEAGLADDRPYIVMQRIEGETLEQRLRRGPLAIAEAVEISRGIADALAEVHALGIVHRDLKPANIILSPRGPKILDFGLAQLRDAPQLTASGASMGTPLTMSPEQVRGHAVDNRADLWALGVMLYEMLTGRSPFAAEHAAAVGMRILNEEPPPPSALRPEVGKELDAAVLKLLRKEPARRYARADDLLADLAGSASQAGVPAPRAVPRVAVTFFEVLSSDANDLVLAAGLTDDLIVDLTRIEGVQVASRDDVRSYRDRVLPPRTLARELGVDYVVLGSVRRVGNRARISAQLARASDGAAVWAERFDRTLDDLFEVQGEVSRRIVEALQLTLQPGEREMLARAPTRSAEAYTFYLRARELMDDQSRENNLRAEELLKRALELDPDFARAHAALGECYCERGSSWWADVDEAAEQAMPHALRALELEPDLVEAHIARAMIHRLRAEPDELLRAAQRITAMDPSCLRAQIWVGWSYMVLGKAELAFAIWEPLMERRPRPYYVAAMLATCCQKLGRRDDAARTWQQAVEDELEFVRRNPAHVLSRAWLAVALVKTGQIDAGLAQVEKALHLAPSDARIRYNAACAYALAGQVDRAIAQITEGVKNLRSYASDWVKQDPDLAALADHPEFVRLFGRT